MFWSKYLAIPIIAILVSSSALAFEREKLLTLDPLPSIRYRQISENAEKNKILGTASFGLTGGWILLNNINKGYDAYRVNNILAGSTLIVSAAVDYMVPNSYMADQKLFSELDMQGIEKENLAYFEIKSRARSSMATRRAAALMFFLSGLSSAIISKNAPNLSESDKLWTNVNAFGFFCLAAYELFTPSDVEVAAEQIDRELAR